MMPTSVVIFLAVVAVGSGIVTFGYVLRGEWLNELNRKEMNELKKLIRKD